MASAKPLPSPGFFKKNLLPFLLVVLVPVFTIAFVPDAEKRMNAAVLRRIETDIAAFSNMPTEEKKAELEFFRRMPISKIMASRDAAMIPLQEMFAPMRATYAVFQWMERIAWGCLLTVAITLLVVGVSVALSLRSQIAQYRALRISWPVLRTSAVIQVVGQAVLIVALMYWAGGLWLDIYVPYLIFIPVIIAGYGVYMLVKAIFRKVEDDHPIQGELIAKEAAPELWERIESIATALGTASPDRLVAGIEPSFFVIEHPVTVAGIRLEGRTLFVSLPMLKIMSLEEADAVLSHELAHFSGEDTLWSRRISPLLGRFEIYLHALYSGFFVPVARFMHFFWDLHLLSIRRLRRIREFRADAVGSTVNSPAAMARALIKISSYCDYRTKTEQGIIEKPAVETDLQLASRLEQGFPGFLSAFASDGDSMKSESIHPFDTHPPIAERIRKLGFDPLEILRDVKLQTPPPRTWHDAIQRVGDLESGLWAKREDELQKYHGLAIAYRVLPETEEEIAAVERHFPRLLLRNAQGGTATLDYRSLRLSTSELEVPFSEISVMSLEKVNDKPQLKITHMTPDLEKTVTEKFFPCEFLCEEGDLLQLFEKYYGRHKAVRPGASGK